MSENRKRDSKSPEISASKGEASSSKSGIHSHYPWIPVNSDEVCQEIIYFVRKLEFFFIFHFSGTFTKSQKSLRILDFIVINKFIL